MNRQEYYRRAYKLLKPCWRDSLVIYRDVINQYANSYSKMLDVGCGHGEFLKSVYDKVGHVYGIDPDREALAKNVLIENKVVGMVESMPFESNFFDIVVLEWVLEHLPDPEKAFREVYRVLKPGGKVIFLTPNVWNYNVWIIRIIPNCFHEFFTKKLYGRQEGDTYPVRYKINSVKKIAKVLELLNFKKTKVILNGDPSYISFNRPLFVFACGLEKILDFKLLNFARVHIIGVYKK